MNLIIQINSLIILFLFLIISDFYYSKVLYKELDIKIEKILLYILLAIIEFFLETKFDYIFKQIINIIMYFIPLFFYNIKISSAKRLLTYGSMRCVCQLNHLVLYYCEQQKL